MPEKKTNIKPCLTGLTEEEKAFIVYVENYTGPFWKNNILPAYKRLAASCELSERRRELMEKHQWVKIRGGWDDYTCLGCGNTKEDGCADDCLWAQAIKGE